MEKININLKTSIYPIEVIRKASYELTDKAYVILSKKFKDTVVATFCFKEKVNEKYKEHLKKIFKEELDNFIVKTKVANNNKKNRLEIIEQALFSEEIIESNESENMGFQDDPLGIAIPWEDKYGKK